MKRLEGIYHYCDQCYQIERAFKNTATRAVIFNGYVVLFIYDWIRPCRSYFIKEKYVQSIDN